MKIAHKFGDHNKIVKGSKHHFDPGGSPGGAQLPTAGAGGALGGGMDASGGSAAGYDDGGEILGGGIAGKLHDYGTAIKDTYNQLTGTKAAGRDTKPLESSDQSSPGAGTGGVEKTRKTLQQVDDMS